MDWVGWFDAHDYEIARQIVQRGVGTLAFVAFLVDRGKPMVDS